VAQVVWFLLNQCKALSSNFSAAKNKTKYKIKRAEKKESGNKKVLLHCMIWGV
jgi:hypothetical protein